MENLHIRLNHTAFDVKDFDWYVNFFENICGMSSYKSRGISPKRQIWYNEGIQLNECAEDKQAEGTFSHIGFHSDDAAAFTRRAIEAGCMAHPDPKKNTWFVLPNGVQVEVKTYQ